MGWTLAAAGNELIYRRLWLTCGLLLGALTLARPAAALPATGRGVSAQSLMTTR